MTEVFNEILNFLVKAGPSITAVLSMVLSVAINIHKQGKLNDNQLNAVNQLAEDLRSETQAANEENAKTKAMCKAVLRENAELKVLLNSVLATYGPIAQPKTDVKEKM